MKPTPQNDLRLHYQFLLGLEEPWRVETVQMDLAAQQVDITLQHLGEQPLVCPKCAGPMTRHDDGSERTWRHLDTMRFTTLLRAKVPRGKCGEHGVLTVAVPWAGKHSRTTWLLDEFVITLLQISVSIQAVAELTRLDWHTVKAIERRAVERGLLRRQSPAADQHPALPGPQLVGMDEKGFLGGQSYVSLCCELGGRPRVLEVALGRSCEVASRLLQASVPAAQRAGVQAVAIDLAAGYLQAARAVLPEALVVHDRFHLERLLNHAVDLVRRAENKAALAKGETGLLGTRWWWGYKQETMDAKFTDEGKEAFRLLSRQFAVVARAWQRKQLFGQLFSLPTRAQAERFFERWCRSALLSRLAPLRKVVKTLRAHKEGILAYFTHRITTAVCEGFNSVIETIKNNARGFRCFEHFRDRILFHLGRLDLRTPATAPA